MTWTQRVEDRERKELEFGAVKEMKKEWLWFIVATRMYEVAGRQGVGGSDKPTKLWIPSMARGQQCGESIWKIGEIG